MWGEDSTDRRRGLFSDLKDHAFGQYGHRCADKNRRAVFRAAVACSRVVMIDLDAGRERRQDERSCGSCRIGTRSGLKDWRKRDDNDPGHCYPEQPAKRPAFTSEHPSGDAGAEYSYSAPRSPSSHKSRSNGRRFPRWRACGSELSRQ
jgi:hypothetical protein